MTTLGLRGEASYSHILFLGNCCADYYKIPSHTVDCVIADIPYGKTKCTWDKPLPIGKMWEMIEHVRKSNAPVILFCAEPLASQIRLSNITNYKYDLIWEKGNATGHLNANKRPLSAHENILVFYGGKYRAIKTAGHKRKQSKGTTKPDRIYGDIEKRTSYDSTERYPRSVLKFSSDKQTTKIHPTQKPLQLMQFLVETYSNAGDTVFDFCAGSGTTAIACKNKGRNFIGFEIDEYFYKTALNRVRYDAL